MISALLIAAGLWTGTTGSAHAFGPPQQTASVDSAGGSFEKVVLVDETTDPMELQVADDGRVFFVERGGAIRFYDPETGETETAGFVPVTTNVEDGMLGMALDPNFSENGWIYVYYSPSSDEPQHLSRLTIEDGRIDPYSEEIMLRVPTQRKECCHSGGSVQFGPDGNLFLSTGDNTNPFESSGYSPIDERPGRAAFDAQRSAANTDDLRGKILRITPEDDGTYTIPDGNLFPKDGSEGRPEIYVMGNRNPFRISIDPRTGWLYWGEVGPDAGAFSEDRGPAGHDELNQARGPGFYGWPYFVGDNKAYRDYDFATETSEGPFDPESPINASVNNTGARELPPAQEPLFWYPYGPTDRFPELGAGGRCAMAGPVYYHDGATVHAQGLPERYDGTVFFYEWSRNYIKAIRLDEQGELAAIQPVAETVSLTRPQDMELGPGGRIYMIEWGTNFGGRNRDAKIVRLDYYDSAARPPVAEVSASALSGSLPLSVTLDASGSRPRTGDGALGYAWDLDGDGETDAEGPRVEHTFEEAGTHAVTVTVEDESGRTASITREIVAGNTAPTVEIEAPAPGGIYEPGARIPYRIRVTDTEDGTVSPERLRVEPKMIYDTHARYLDAGSALTGSFEIPADDALLNEEGPFLFRKMAGLEVSYRDGGAEDATALTGTAEVVLQPRTKEAEHWRSAQGTEPIVFGPDGSRTALAMEDGDYVRFDPVSFRGIEAITLRAALGAGGTIELRLDGPDGPLLGSVDLPPAARYRPRTAGPGAGTSGSELQGESGEETEGEGSDEETDPAQWVWRHPTVPIEDPGGSHALFLIVRGPPDRVLTRIDQLRFRGPGVTARDAAAETSASDGS